MQSVLLDAGALVAILNRNDRHHAGLTELLEGFDGRLFTTWPVIGEACALVSERARGKGTVYDIAGHLFGADRSRALPRDASAIIKPAAAPGMGGRMGAS